MIQAIYCDVDMQDDKQSGKARCVNSQIQQIFLDEKGERRATREQASSFVPRRKYKNETRFKGGELANLELNRSTPTHKA